MCDMAAISCLSFSVVLATLFGATALAAAPGCSAENDEQRILTTLTDGAAPPAIDAGVTSAASEQLDASVS